MKQQQGVGHYYYKVVLDAVRWIRSDTTRDHHVHVFDITVTSMCPASPVNHKSFLFIGFLHLNTQPIGIKRHATRQWKLLVVVLRFCGCIFKKCFVPALRGAAVARKYLNITAGEYYRSTMTWSWTLFQEFYGNERDTFALKLHTFHLFQQWVSFNPQHLTSNQGLGSNPLLKLNLSQRKILSGWERYAGFHNRLHKKLRMFFVSEVLASSEVPHHQQHMCWGATLWLKLFGDIQLMLMVW